jgi:hypothetical protein
MMGNKTDLQDFLKSRTFSYEVYGSGGTSLYRAFGLRRFTDSPSILNPVNSVNEVFKAFGAMAKFGVGIPEGDVAQMGGTFVIDTSGTLLYTHRSEMPSDNPALTTVLAALDNSKTGTTAK